MIERFQFYLDTNAARKESSDPREAKALIERAFQRMSFVSSLEINNDNATFIFEDVYESLREAAQAIMSSDGYKPYSHESVISFLKEFYKFSEIYIETFNKYRILRNRCVYKADKVSVETCKDAIEFLQKFLPELKQEFEKKQKRGS